MPSAVEPDPRSHALSDARRQKGLTQEVLARQVGVSRQFLNQVEAGKTLPNVAVALQLAAVLGTTVEALFARPAATSANLPVVLSAPTLREGARVRLARVGASWIAHPAETADSLAAGFGAADAVLVDAQQARLLRPASELAANLLIAGCDPALHLLQPSARPGDWYWIDCGSGRALDLLAAGQVHVAGIHYSGPGSRGNITEVDRRDTEQGWTLVGFTRWEQGWILRPGLSARFTGVGTLRRGDWHLANREPSAAARRWLDGELARVRLAPASVRGYDSAYRSGHDAARAVAEGRADVTVGPRAVAQALGLEFVAAEAVHFDLVAPTRWWRSPEGRLLRERIRQVASSAELATLPGYSATDAGVERRRAGQPAPGPQ